MDFFEVFFFAADFFGGAFREADLEVVLAAPFLAAVFLAPVFLAALFLPLGRGGIFAPDRRASLNPIAIACFGFFTLFPLRPD